MLRLLKKHHAASPALEVLDAFKAKADATRHEIAEARAKLERLHAIAQAGYDARRASEAAKLAAAEFRKTWVRDGGKYTELAEVQRRDEVAASAARVAETAAKNAAAAGPELARNEDAIRSLQVDLRGHQDAIDAAAGVIVSEEETGALIEQLERASRQFCEMRARLMVLRQTVDPRDRGNAGASPISAALFRCKIPTWEEERSAARAHDFVEGVPRRDDVTLEEIAKPFRARLEQLLDDQQ